MAIAPLIRMMVIRITKPATPALLLCLAAPALFAATTPSDPLHRDTPQSAVLNFLEAAHAKDYPRARRYFDLRSLPENERAKQGPDLAKELSQVLDRDARFDIGALSQDPDGEQTDSLPPDRELLDTFVVDGQQRQIQLQRIKLKSGARVWLVSADSLPWIPKLVVATSNSVIEQHLPPVLVNFTLLNTPLWRWVALLLAAILLAIFSRWLSRIAVFIIDKIVGRIAPHLAAGGRLKSLIAPLQLLFPVLVFRAVPASLGLSPLLRLAVERAINALLFLSVAWLCARIVDIFIDRIATALKAHKSTGYRSVLPLASRVTKLIIFLLVTAAILSNWGYNTSTILAGLGVGGIALALAAQKTIENLFGGVAVISDRPVAIGDYCTFGDRSGTVEDIGLRSTRIRTVDRTLVTVPNGSFSAMTIENFAGRDKILFHIKLNLRRDTNPNQVRTLLASLGETFTKNPKIEAGATPVRFIGIGAYSLDLEIFVYILTSDYDEYLKIQQELLLRILDQVAAAGTALALPTQTSIIDSGTPAAANSPSPAGSLPNGAR